MPVLQPYIDHPETWGAQAVAPVMRRGVPEGPFEVTRADIAPDQRFAYFERKREEQHKHTPLTPGDMLMHLDTGMICRVVQKIDDWRYRAEAWGAPESEEDFETFLRIGGKGSWCVWGYAVMKGEEFPLWFPYRPAQIITSHLPNGEPNPDYVEAYYDMNPGVRKGAKPMAGGRVKLKEQLSPKEAKMLRRSTRAMRRAIEEGGWDDLMDGMEEPMDPGDVKVTPFGAKPVKGTPISYPGQKTRSKAEDDI